MISRREIAGQLDLWSDEDASAAPTPVGPDLRCSAAAWLPHQVLAAVARGELYEITRQLGQEVVADVEGNGDATTGVVTERQAEQLYQFEDDGLVRRCEGAAVRYCGRRRAAAQFVLTAAGLKLFRRWSHLVEPHKPFAKHPRLRKSAEPPTG